MHTSVPTWTVLKASYFHDAFLLWAVKCELENLTAVTAHERHYQPFHNPVLDCCLIDEASDEVVNAFGGQMVRASLGAFSALLRGIVLHQTERHVLYLTGLRMGTQLLHLRTLWCLYPCCSHWYFVVMISLNAILKRSMRCCAVRIHASTFNCWSVPVGTVIHACC